MSVQADSGSSAVLKIQINIKGQQDREVVKKCTYKGFEVVEINGAVFYRKRKSCADDLQPAAQKRLQGEVHEVHEEADLPAAPTIAQHADAEEGCVGDVACAAGAVDMEQQPQEEAVGGTEAAAAAAAAAFNEAVLLPLPEEVNPEDLKTQLDNCLPASCPKAIAVQFYLDRLLMHGASELDQSHATAAYSQAARRVLHSFSRLLQQQAELAGSLLLQARSSAAAHSSSSSDGLALQAGGGAADAPLDRYVQLAPMVRELSHGSLLTAHLQHQLMALGQEEEAWAGLRQKYSEAGAAGPGAAEELAGAAPEAPAEAPAPANDVSLLQQTEESVNTALALQVESLSAFLSKVDAMVAKGEQACMMLQADYHQQKFKTFPHVNSPAWLIRQIISKQQSLEAGEEQAGGEQQQQA